MYVTANISKKHDMQVKEEPIITICQELCRWSFKKATESEIKANFSQGQMFPIIILSFKRKIQYFKINFLLSSSSLDLFDLN